MKIPDYFKKVQKETFQDKRVTHHKPSETRGSLNTATVSPSDEVNVEFDCNFKIVNDELQAKEYGLTIGRDAVLTVSEHKDIAEGDFICFEYLYYRVIGCIVRDSHDKYLLKRWTK